MTVKRFCSALTLASLTLAIVLAQPLEGYAQDSRAPNVQAPNSQALLDRIDRLERDIRTLNQQIARMPAKAPAAKMSVAPADETPAVPPVEYTEGEGMMSRVMVRLGALEDEVRTATGQSESLSFRIDQLTQRFDKLLVDLDYRLARLEGTSPGSFDTQPTISAAPSPPGVFKVGEMPAVGQGGDQQGTVRKDGTYQPGAQGGSVLGSMSKSKLDEILSQDGENAQDGAATPADAAPADTAPGAVAAVQAPPVPDTVPTVQPAVLPEGSVQERYRFAFDLTRQARYEEAEIAFKAFIDAHGEEDLANNARYWLAETYYVRKRYMDAAQAFFQAYQKAPEGPKAQDSLLKLGMSMAGLDKPTEACTTFGKLRKEFTPLKANIEQALNRETKRLECK